MSATATLPAPATETPIVAPGDRVQFWTSQTGLAPQSGTVCASQLVYSTTYAEIEPDTPPHRHVFLFRGAVWGFEPMREGR